MHTKTQNFKIKILYKYMERQTTPKQNKTESIRFKVTKSELAQIKGCSALEHKSMSKYIRTNLNL